MSRYHCLLIGIDRYQDPRIPPLKYCTNDVLSLRKVIKENVPNADVKILTDYPSMLPPTRENILGEIKDLSASAQADDIILVHFSGHGTVINGKSMLIPADASDPNLAFTSIPLDELKKRMDISACKSKILIVDACYSGGGPRGLTLSREEFFATLDNFGTGWAVITSCSQNEAAYEGPDEKHGAFVYFLIRGLSGEARTTKDAPITLTDIYSYVSRNLTSWVKSTYNAVQTPTLRSNIIGNVPLSPGKCRQDESNIRFVRGISSDELSPFYAVPRLGGLFLLLTMGIVGTLYYFEWRALIRIFPLKIEPISDMLIYTPSILNMLAICLGWYFGKLSALLGKRLLGHIGWVSLLMANIVTFALWMPLFENQSFFPQTGPFVEGLIKDLVIMKFSILALVFNIWNYIIGLRVSTLPRYENLTLVREAIRAHDSKGIDFLAFDNPAPAITLPTRWYAVCSIVVGVILALVEYFYFSAIGDSQPAVSAKTTIMLRDGCLVTLALVCILWLHISIRVLYRKVFPQV